MPFTVGGKGAGEGGNQSAAGASSLSASLGLMGMGISPSIAALSLGLSPAFGFAANQAANNNTDGLGMIGGILNGFLSNPNLNVCFNAPAIIDHPVAPVPFILRPEIDSNKTIKSLSLMSVSIVIGLSISEDFGIAIAGLFAGILTIEAAAIVAAVALGISALVFVFWFEYKASIESGAGFFRSLSVSADGDMNSDVCMGIRGDKDGKIKGKQISELNKSTSKYSGNIEPPNIDPNDPDNKPKHPFWFKIMKGIDAAIKFFHYGPDH